MLRIVGMTSLKLACSILIHCGRAVQIIVSGVKFFKCLKINSMCFISFVNGPAAMPGRLRLVYLFSQIRDPE